MSVIDEKWIIIHLTKYCYSSCSYFLYSISHPNKHGEPLVDLSADPKAHVGEAENLSCSSLKVERVIQRTFQEYGVKLPITEKIRSLFKSKLWRMGQRISKLGSVKRKDLLENWKCGCHSVWQIQVDTVMVIKELVKVNQKNEALLAAETTKRQKLEEQVQITQATLNQKVSTLETRLASTQAELKCVSESNDQLSKSNKRLAAAVTKGTPDTRKKRRVLSSVHVNSSGYERNRFPLISVNHSHSWRVREYMLHPSHLYTMKQMMLKFLI